MSKELMKKLGLEIKESRVRFTIANGKTIPSLGQTIAELEIGRERFPTKIEIIDSRKQDLILGSDFYVRNKGKIDYENKRLILKIGEKEIELPIYYSEKEIIEEQLSEEDNESDFDDEFEEETEEMEWYNEEYEENDEEYNELEYYEIEEKNEG
jgi:hypothetical protein